MISMASAGSAFRPYYRPEFIPAPEPPLRKLYSDPEPAASSPIENGSNKARRKRTTFTQHQATVLEREYLSEHYMIRDKRAQLAESLGLSEAQVKTWFQNRRAKDKREKKSDSPHSPTSSADVSVKEERLDTSQTSSAMSPSPPMNPPARTPPPQLKPTPSPVLQNHHVLSNLLQAAPLPDYTNYLVHLGLAPIDALSPMNSIVPKTEPFCGDGATKDIYSIPPIYEQSFGSIYGHIPISASAITVPSSYAPEPLAPVENHDTMSTENTQLTSL